MGNVRRMSFFYERDIFRKIFFNVFNVFLIMSEEKKCKHFSETNSNDSSMKIKILKTNKIEIGLNFLIVCAG